MPERGATQRSGQASKARPAISAPRADGKHPPTTLKSNLPKIPCDLQSLETNGRYPTPRHEYDISRSQNRTPAACGKSVAMVVMHVTSRHRLLISFGGERGALVMHSALGARTWLAPPNRPERIRGLSVGATAIPPPPPRTL